MKTDGLTQLMYHAQIDQARWHHSKDTTTFYEAREEMLGSSLNFSLKKSIFALLFISNGSLFRKPGLGCVKTLLMIEFMTVEFNKLVSVLKHQHPLYPNGF